MQHPYSIEKLAAERLSELRRESARQRMVDELRIGRRHVGAGRRGWARLRRALRLHRPATV